MTSSDNQQYVTVEMFNAGIAELKTGIDELKTEIREVKYDIRMNEHDIAHLQTSIYWGLALVALGAAFAPTLLDLRRDIKIT